MGYTLVGGTITKAVQTKANVRKYAKASLDAFLESHWQEVKFLSHDDTLLAYARFIRFEDVPTNK